jgi:glutaredoxin
MTVMITVYSKPDCHLCEEAMAGLRRLQGELGFALREHPGDQRRRRRVM